MNRKEEAIERAVYNATFAKVGANPAPCTDGRVTGLFFFAQNENFRRTQNGAEREVAAKVERGGGLMLVFDMMQSGFQYYVYTC